METKSKNKLQRLPPQLITPPPAYQFLGNNLSFPNTPLTHNAPLPSGPNIQQQTTAFQTHPYEPPLNMNQSTSYEIPQPSNKSTKKTPSNTNSKTNGYTESTTNRFRSTKNNG